MKKTLIFFAVIFFASCTDSSKFYPSLDEKNYSNTRTIDSDSQFNKLETRMQWASFIAARTLESSMHAQGELLGLLNDGNNTIEIKTLLGANSATPYFKEQFVSHLYWYSLILCSLGKPEPGEVPPTHNPNPNMECVTAFLEYINNVHCLEFYFPVGMKLNPVLPITSTAHPLTNSDNNYGFKLYYDEDGYVTSQEIQVSPMYLKNNKDIIVARPINGNVDCDYSVYGVDDFTMFLD